MSEWMRLLQGIRAGGRLLVLSCEPWEVEIPLGGLRPEGVLLTTSCPPIVEAGALLTGIGSMFHGPRR